MNDTDTQTKSEPRDAVQLNGVPSNRVSNKYVIRMDMDEMIARMLVFFSRRMLSKRVYWKP